MPFASLWIAYPSGGTTNSPWAALWLREISGKHVVRATLNAMNRRLEVLPSREHFARRRRAWCRRCGGDGGPVVAPSPETRPGQMEPPDLKPFDKGETEEDAPGKPKPESGEISGAPGRYQ